MGQCHPVPDDPDLKAVLAKHTRNHLRIWNMYNFARRILPGTDMGKARARRPHARGRPGCTHGAFHAVPRGAAPALCQRGSARVRVARASGGRQRQLREC
jgi:hypothetical protein